MGGWLCSLMIFSLLVRAWNSFLNGADGLIHETHFHDIGKLCFAFTAFWGYLTFGQYLVIWYGNMAEETYFMRERLISPWKWVTVAAVVLVFFTPFFGLLSRYTKVKRFWMTLFALSSLFGMWLIRYIEVYPSTQGIVSRCRFDLGDRRLCSISARGLLLHPVRECLPRMRVTLITSPREKCRCRSTLKPWNRSGA